MTNDGCVSGNYGSYREEEGVLSLQSEIYFDCGTCYHTSASATKASNANESFTFYTNAESLDVSSSTGDLYAYMGSEDIGNPFYSTSVQYCDNQGNAN